MRVIKTEQITIKFKSKIAVNKVSLQVKPEEIYGLVGPDGAGKTTLLRTICGLITPHEGEVYVKGFPRQQIEKVRENLGYLPQRFSLYSDLTVRENIDFFGSMYKLSKKTVEKRAGEILEITNLSAFQDHLANNLSGGMKQKLALTCALINRPEILVLDEPTYGVDPNSRKEFWKILYSLNKEGITILVSTPYMDEAELCTKVAFINQGKLVAVDSPLNLRKNFPYKVLELCAGIKEKFEIFRGIEGVFDISVYGDKYHLLVKDAITTRYTIENLLLKEDIQDFTLEEVSPTMEDVFVSLAELEGV